MNSWSLTKPREGLIKSGHRKSVCVRPSGRYRGRIALQLLGEIARGGMGAVLEGHDPDLGRDLAVKVLLESHKASNVMVGSFGEVQVMDRSLAKVIERGVVAVVLTSEFL